MLSNEEFVMRRKKLRVFWQELIWFGAAKTEKI
jgi:hypothetical protein